MAGIEELKGYVRKLKRAVENADFTFFSKRLVKKSKIDNILCCIIATLPDSFKEATKDNTINIENYPAVASYNRLIKVINRPFVLSKDYYFIEAKDIDTLTQAINKNIEHDIKKIEEM